MNSEDLYAIVNKQYYVYKHSMLRSNKKKIIRYLLLSYAVSRYKSVITNSKKYVNSLQAKLQKMCFYKF